MKTIINKWTALLLAGIAFGACSEQTEYDDTSFSAVERLLYPSDGDQVDLIEQADANLYFEWEVSEVGTPVYTVVFMDAEKHEVGRYLADNNGQKASLKMLHSQLNQVAGDAGIEPDATGDLYWTVCAGLGGAEKLSTDEPHRLTVTRYATIDAPVRLYVTGEGSEFTDDPAQAQEMRNLGDGRFEIYTKFTGAFSFINRNEAGNKRTFGVSEEGRLVEAADAAGTGDGIYHVVVDFNESTVTMERIESVKYHYCWTPDPSAEMEYAGNGVWKYDICWTENDSRYRFDVVIDGVDYIWGYSNSNMSSAPTSLTGSSYNISMRKTEDIDQWSYGFKFFSALKNIECTIVLDCSPSAANYYHYFEFGFEPVAKVVSPTEPAADAAVELSAIAGSSETFSWALPEDMTTAEKQLTTYAVVFYGDAAAATEIARADAGMNQSVSVSHADLESHAAKAGIAAEATGDLYWAVESELLGSTAVSEVRKLTVTRLQGIPEQVYISGEASEFASEYGAFKTLGAGRFEIYTRLMSGNYTISDGTDASARLFSIADGLIEERTDAVNVSDSEAIYRITLDFATGVSTFERIEGDPYMQIAAWTEKVYPLHYVGAGIWETGQITPDFTREEDWNGDTRFFVKMTIDGVEYKLAHQQDFGGSDPTDTKPEGTDERYFVSFWEDDSQWNYHYKIDQSYRGQNSKVLSNFRLNLNSAVENYYVYLEY